MLSLCTQMCDWMERFELTGPRNLQRIIQAHEAGIPIEWVILDYDSRDDLVEFLTSLARKQLESGLVRFYSLKEPVECFRLTHSKNIAHRLGRGEFLFNLDGDNYITEGQLETIWGLIQKCEPGKHFLRTRNRKIRGQLGCFAEDYYKIGGYDEISGDYWSDDRDLYNRLTFLGLSQVVVGKRFFSRLQTAANNPRLRTAPNRKYINRNWKNRTINPNTEGWGVAELIRHPDGEHVSLPPNPTEPD